MVPRSAEFCREGVGQTFLQTCPFKNLLSVGRKCAGHCLPSNWLACAFKKSAGHKKKCTWLGL